MPGFPKRPPAPKMSRTIAINEYCKSCIYDPKAGGSWREQVEMCGSQHCPLWQHRPKTVATINANRKCRSEGINLDALVDGLPDDDEETVEA